MPDHDCVRFDNFDSELMIVVAIQDQEALDSCLSAMNNKTQFRNLKPGLLSFIVIALYN